MQKPKTELEFKTSTNEILEVLMHSKEYGNVVGISSPLLGAGIFITAVEKVILDYETIIHVKPFDVNGCVLASNVLKLTDIVSVCSFRSHYENLYQEKTPNISVNVYSY